MRNLSVREAIIEFLKTNTGSKPAKIKLYTNKPMDQVYTMLANLAKKGILKRRNHAYWLVDSVPMTALNPEQPNVEVKIPKPYVATTVERERELMREQDLHYIETSELKNQIADLQEQLQDMSVKYYDAVAVINYLEKFFNIKK